MLRFTLRVFAGVPASGGSSPISIITTTHKNGTVLSPFGDVQGSLHRSYRLEQVQDTVPHGLIFARQENEQVYSYVGFEGLSFTEVAKRMLRVPEPQRTFHVVTGRREIPCDFFGDLDLERDISVNEMDRLLLECIQLVSSQVTAAAERVRQPSGKKSNKKRPDVADPRILVLKNPNPLKRSLHLHMSYPNLCFSDYRCCRIIAEHVNRTLESAVFDTQTYRERGMLRIAFNDKLRDAAETASSSAAMTAVAGEALLPYSGGQSGLKRLLGESTKTWTQEQQMVASFCIRESFLLSPKTSWPKDTAVDALGTVAVPYRLQEHHFSESSSNADGSYQGKMKALRQEKATEYDQQGRPIPRFLSESKKDIRFSEVVKSLRALPNKAAEHYDQWIRVGLALHNFGCEDKYFEHWVTFSLRCPKKFSRESCKKMWVKFIRHPDHQNWRRGYCYITKTLWRELGIIPKQ